MRMHNYFKHHNSCKMEDGELVEVTEDGDNNEEYILAKKPHTTSKVWAHFGLKGDENGTPVQTEIDKPI